MRFLFKSSKESTEASNAPMPLFDIHNHCLFQIDDGPRTAEESIAILKGLFRMGFRGVMATPHFNHRLFASTDTDVVASRILKLQSSGGDAIPQIVPSAEIMARGDFMTLIESGDFPRTGNAVLLEFGALDTVDIPSIESALFRIFKLGGVPILAHVERYSFFQRHPDILFRLKESGALLQLDLLSLEDRFGRRAAEFARVLLDQRAIDIAATDIHRLRELPEIEMALNTIKTEYPEQFEQLVSINPQRVFLGLAADVQKS